MKIRTGFVSNSSSNSFILFFRKGKKCPHCGRRDFEYDEFTRLFEHTTIEDTEFLGDGLQFVKSWVADAFYDEKYRDEILEKVSKASKKKGEIAIVKVSYHDSYMNDKIKNSENIEVLYSGEY